MPRTKLLLRPREPVATDETILTAHVVDLFGCHCHPPFDWRHALFQRLGNGVHGTLLKWMSEHVTTLWQMRDLCRSDSALPLLEDEMFEFFIRMIACDQLEEFV